MLEYYKYVAKGGVGMLVVANAVVNLEVSMGAPEIAERAIVDGKACQRRLKFYKAIAFFQLAVNIGGNQHIDSELVNS